MRGCHSPTVHRSRRRGAQRPVVARVVLGGLVALACALAYALPVQPALAEDGERAATAEFGDEARALLDVCDALGWTTEKTAAGPVAIHELIDLEPAFRDDWGFVLADEGGSVTVLDSVGATRTLQRSDTPARPGEAALSPISLEEAAERVLDPPPVEWFDSFDAAWQADEYTAHVIAAAHCRRAGRPDLAHRLLDALQPWEGGSPLDLARRMMAERALWRVVVDFEQPEVTRVDLRARLRVWSRAFRGTEHEAMAANLLAEMERMVPEDEERARRPARTDELSRAETIEELIWLYRDCGWGGRIRVGPESWRDVDAELRPFGWQAVPALIGALSDTRTTRAVTQWRDFVFRGHHVMRVGDRAQAELAQRGIIIRADRAPTQCGEPGWEQVVERGEAWWRKWGPLGELAVVREQIRTLRDWRREAAFRRLAELRPDEALERTQHDLADAWTDSARRDAVTRMARIPGDAADAALESCVTSNAPLGVRMRAAIGLSERGRAGASSALADLFDEAAAAERLPDGDTLRLVVQHISALGAAQRARICVAAESRPEDLRRVVATAWRSLFSRGEHPEFEGAARDFVADLALDALLYPALLDLVDPIARLNDLHGPASAWTRDEAAGVLDLLRGANRFDRSAPPLRRLVAARALAAAECADRRLPGPPSPTLVAVADPPVADDALGIADLSVSPGHHRKPDDASLAPLRSLLGALPDGDSVIAALTGAFAARPKWSRGVVLRLWRADGPLHAEVLFEAGSNGRGLRFERGDGESFVESTTLWHPEGPGIDITDVELPTERIDRSLRRAADGDWILDLRIRTN